MKLGIRESTFTIAFVLILGFILFIGFYPIISYRILSDITGVPPEGFSTIYVLDQQKRGTDYPELLVVNQNSTFSVWVVVENQMGVSQTYEILQKVVSDTISTFPVVANVEEIYSKTLENGETWETWATVSINETGNYAVIFELWIYNVGEEAYGFSNNYCVLKIEVVDQI